MSRKKRVLVIAGGPSSEHDVSINTGRMVLKHLNPRAYVAKIAILQKNGVWRFGERGKPISLGTVVQKIAAFDIVFIAMHGAFGEDGRLQALLEWLDIPYTGSDISSSAAAMDKDFSNSLYERARIPVPPSFIVRKGEKIGTVRFPVVIKPVRGGSSVGISIAKTSSEVQKALLLAFKEDDRVMVQKYINGREFTCGILEDTNGVPFALPPTEIRPRNSTFFDYQAKYVMGGSLETTPADLSRTMTKKIQSLALLAHRALGCSGMSRSDFILKGSTFFILETNTIPGMTQTSLLPQAAHAAGINFPKMLDLILRAGLRAYRTRDKRVKVR